MIDLSVDVIRMRPDLEKSLLRNGVCGVRKQSYSQRRYSIEQVPQDFHLRVEKYIA